jgi:5'/3'-nucleotidase
LEATLPLKIIVTNDDGIDAPGILALEKALDGIGKLIVAAPAGSNSGVSHQVTTHDPIRVDQTGENRYRIEGTPADCTRIAVTHIAPDADWVVAGINRGGNLGADVYISGTVAAAREGAFLGYPGIAVSHYVAKDREVDWDLATRRIRPLLARLLGRRLPSGHFWNVNLPHPNGNDPELDVVYCPLDINPFDVRYKKNKNHFLYDGDYHKRPRHPGNDVDVCFSGKISVTRIPLDIGGGPQ